MTSPSPPSGAAPVTGTGTDRPKGKLRWIVLVLLVVPLVLASVSLFTPWYQYAETGSSSNLTVSLSIWHCETIQGSYEGISVSGTNCTLQAENNTVSLYNVVLGLELGGVVAGIVAAVMGVLVTVLRRPWRSSHLRLPVIFAFMAGALLLAAPLVLFVEQPGALEADQKAHTTSNTVISSPCGGTNWQGPNQSFFGSCPVSGNTFSWGPAWGWWLSLVAGIIFILGGVFALRYRRQTLDSATQASPAPSPGNYPAPQGSPYGSPPPSGYPGYPPPGTAPAPNSAGPWANSVNAPPPSGARPSYSERPCVTCGTMNPTGASTCHVCKAQLF